VLARAKNGASFAPGLGHLGIQFARRMGFQVAAIARGPEEEGLAKKLGAHHYFLTIGFEPNVNWQWHRLADKD